MEKLLIRLEGRRRLCRDKRGIRDSVLLLGLALCVAAAIKDLALYYYADCFYDIPPRNSKTLTLNYFILAFLILLLSPLHFLV